MTPAAGADEANLSPYWFAAPATRWEEALPIGNGRLGAMIFGGIERDRLQLNDATAWSGTPRRELAEPRVDRATAAAALTAARAAVERGDSHEADAQLKLLQHRYTQSYLPFADLFVETRVPGVAGTVVASGYRRQVDLASGRHEVSYRLGEATISRGAFASAPDDVIVMTITTDAPHGIDVTLGLTSQLRHEPAPSTALEEGSAALLLRMPSDVSPPVDEDPYPVSYSDDPGESLHGAVLVRWQHDGVAEAAPSGAQLRATGIRHATILLATRTTFAGMGVQPVGDALDALRGARSAVEAAAMQDADELRARQCADHAAYFDRVAFALSGTGADPARTELPIDERLTRANAAGAGVAAADPQLVPLLFDFGRYLLISCSRPGGVPANLQGIWNDELQAPWSGNYTTNINVEMNYWQAEVANLPELTEPLFDLIEVLAERGTETAHRIYGAPGWVAHHNTDIWGYTQPVGRGNHQPRWAFWPLAGAWLLRHMWERLLFGGDDEFAARMWRVARPAAEFYLAWLVELPDGTLGTSPSTSPENDFRAADGEPASASASSTMDLVLIKDLLSMVDALATRLGHTDDAVAQQAARAVPRIPGPRIGAEGTIVEWASDPEQIDLAHRHLSHLYFAYPGDLPLDDELRTAVIASLDQRGDEATGWSLAWKLALRARLRQPAKVSALFDLVFRDMSVDRGAWIGGLYPNLLVAHPPFQIDGNLGFVAGVVECLVDSSAGRIELLPCLPDELQSGSVRGLVARPGVELELSWDESQLVWARLVPSKPGARGRHRVVHHGQELTVDLSDGPVELTGGDFSLGRPSVDG